MERKAVSIPDARSGRADARQVTGRRRGLLARILSSDSVVAVEVEGLMKRYGRLLAVDGLSFRAERGKILALLGPNGAGKTSALECVEGIKRPDAGSIRVMGMDGTIGYRALAMGVQLQTNGLPASMTPREAFRFFSGYRGRKPDFSAASASDSDPR